MAKLPLLHFDDNSYPDELIVNLQGMDRLWAFKSRIVVPISHIESIRVAEPANIQDKRIVKVVGASGIGGFKVGDFLEWNRGKEKNRLLFWDVHHRQAVVDGKVVAITLRDERYDEELVLQFDDCRSEKVMEVLQAKLNEASS